MIGAEELPEVALQARTLDGRYRLLYSIGEGRYAQVKLAVDSETGKKVAIKIMKEVCATDPKSVECFLSEVTILSQVAPCQHVVSLQRVCLSNNESPYSRNPGPLYYVMKVAENGELFKFLLHTPKFDEPFARHFFSQLLEGLEHLHEEGFAHRDIKPENILIDKKLGLKLCDFGFATRCKSEQGQPILFDTSDPVGSPEYNAPEITQRALAGKKYDAQVADIFSAGCVLFMMVLGSAPFESSSQCDRYYSRFCLQNKASFWKIFSFSCKPSSSFKDLIHGMLEPDPAIRLTLADIKKHPWITEAPQPTEEEVRGYMGERIKIVFEKTLDELRVSLKTKGAPDAQQTAVQQGMKSLSRVQAEGLRQKYGKQVKEINQCVVRKLQHIKQQRLLLKQAQPPSLNLHNQNSNNNYHNQNNTISKTFKEGAFNDNPVLLAGFVAPSKQMNLTNPPEKACKFSSQQHVPSHNPFTVTANSSTDITINNKNSKNLNDSSFFEGIHSQNQQQSSSKSSMQRKQRPSAGYQSDDCIQTESLLPPLPKRQHDSAPSSLTNNESS